MTGVLHGRRVLDVSEGVPGAYCTKLFGDAGADVVKVETASGDGLRGRGSGGLFAYLHAGKRSVVGEWRDLARSADVLVASEAVDVEALRSANPGLIVVMITPFGAKGPWADRPANEFTLQALCGSTGSRGWPDEEPVSAGGEVGLFLSGLFAAVAALGALFRAGKTGQGEVIDVSTLECMSISFSYYASVSKTLEGAGRRGPTRLGNIPAVETTEDGYVAITTVTTPQFHAFLQMIGREDLIDGPLSDYSARRLRFRELQPIIDAFTTRHGTADILARATALRIPAAPVCNGATIRDVEHFRTRGLWVKTASGFEQPGLPYRLNGALQTEVGPAPELGEHTGKIDWTPRPAPTASTDVKLPLDGVRIVDMTSFWAGPIGSLFLAALGADVVHVEGPVHMDSNRGSAAKGKDGKPSLNVSPRFHGVNNSKRGFIVDLKQPEGVALFKELLAGADVLIENNSPRVMDGFGLGWDVIHQINPRLTMTRMSGFGLDGPWRDNVAYAFTAEAISGLAWLTGSPEGKPTVIGGPSDPIAGAQAAFATILALMAREESAKGSLIDCCLVDATVAVAAEQTIEWQRTGVLAERRGNRSPTAAPQGLYPCAGEDKWLAISVFDDDQWPRLRKVLGEPPALQGEALATLEGRQASHDLIDEAIRAWAAPLDVDEAADKLLAAGVPAAPVALSTDIDLNPQMRARGFFEEVEAKDTGPYLLPIMPFRFASVSKWSKRAAPDFGEHTDEILDELNVDPARRQTLRAERVIA